jgi:Lrp/AsnC family transcriptional regulator, leucine-responsive regulatory protein
MDQMRIIASPSSLYEDWKSSFLGFIMLDAFDRLIVQILAENARISLKDLAAEVGLSSPSASERLKRLEERGVIRAFTVDLAPEALGYPLQAIVRIKPLPGQLHAVQRLVEEIPEISECDKVTGEDCFIARLHLRSIEELDAVLDRITDKAETNTSIVKSKTVRRRLPPL